MVRQRPSFPPRVMRRDFRFSRRSRLVIHQWRLRSLKLGTPTASGSWSLRTSARQQAPSTRKGRHSRPNQDPRSGEQSDMRAMPRHRSPRYRSGAFGAGQAHLPACPISLGWRGNITDHQSGLTPAPPMRRPARKALVIDLDGHTQVTLLLDFSREAQASRPCASGCSLVPIGRLRAKTAMPPF